jgi:hypothetical protein
VTVNNSTSIAVLEAYIARYKGTVFADLAQARLEEVRKAQSAEITNRTVVVEPKDETVVASAETPEPAEIASAEAAEPQPAESPPDPALLARQLQTELKRVGCYANAIDGDWGRGSVAALERFSDASGLDLPVDEPTGEALDAVTSKTDTVCTSQPCPAGLERDDEGQCVKPTGAAHSKASAPASTKSTRTKTKSKPKNEVVREKKRKPRTVVVEKPRRKSMMTKSGKFDCAIYGTNTALQDLHRRQGHCE